MITKIELTNFKSHAHTVIEPGRVTALVGPNGVGKSSLLAALQYLSKFLRSTLAPPGTPLEFLYHDGNPSYFVRSGFHELSFSISGFNKEKDNWSVKVSLNTQDFEKLLIDWQLNNQFYSSYLLGKTLYAGEHPKEIATKLDEVFYFKGISKYLGEPSYSEEIPPRIRADGQGLASTIANLMTSESDAHQAIVESLHKIVPLVKNVRVRPAKVPRTEKRVISIDGKDFPFDEKREVVGHEIIFDTQTIKGLPAHAMSDGTLLALGLLTLLWSAPDAHLILLDDIETGLHPLAQRQLMQVLKNFAEKHDHQIIVTSHSPYIIDELDAKDVWVMATDKEGITHAKRLSDHPEAGNVLSVLTTGEFASAYDEEWVLDEAQPAELVHG